MMRWDKFIKELPEDMISLKEIKQITHMSFQSITKISNFLHIEILGIGRKRYINKQYLDRIILPIDEKWCLRCLKPTKLIDMCQYTEFKHICQECNLIDQRKRYKAYKTKNREKVRERESSYYQLNKETIKEKLIQSNYRERAAELKRKRIYGVEKEQYQKLLDDSNGRCNICGEISTKLHLDHDHYNGKIRHLLCYTCNVGLGSFKDDVNKLQKAIDYLNRYKD